jgi:K+ transporter
MASAVRISWLGLAYPCLLLAYIGQAAYISVIPAAYANPFFDTVPPHMLWPSLIIAILAAIVASQALITSTFQLLSQVMNTSYFPHINMIYTSDKFHGQVYIPIANWLMMIGTVIVTVVYNNVSIRRWCPSYLMLHRRSSWETHTGHALSWLLSLPPQWSHSSPSWSGGSIGSW